MRELRHLQRWLSSSWTPTLRADAESTDHLLAAFLHVLPLTVKTLRSLLANVGGQLQRVDARAGSLDKVHHVPGLRFDLSPQLRFQDRNGTTLWLA